MKVISIEKLKMFHQVPESENEQHIKELDFNQAT
jgi:hypothetical protein